jgi:class 3 adenylate cyclase/tetratricopeptide (TPR) repeat protein
MEQIADWLKKLGMSEYTERFADNHIDESILRELTDHDLKDLGVVSLGHRRKMLRAIAELARSTPGPPQPPAMLEPRPRDVAERRQVTVMFCDLVGSTGLAASMDPEDLREVISAYQACVAEIARGSDGFVAKYMGDGVLVYFGYPQAHEDDAERAVRAGLELITAVAGLKTRASLQTRVGIATGLVVIGDLIGSGEAQERGILGETPNLAARLQGIAQPNTAVIAEGTRRLLGDLFELEDLGAKDLKGIAAPARAWVALRASSVESRFEALHAAGLTPLVGREEELELLLRRWSRANTGEGQVVLLSGEAGIGKSRLTAALMERLAREPYTRLRYFCSPQHTDNALYPIISHMERAAGLAHDDKPQAKLDKLDAVLVQTSTTLEDAALLADLLSLFNDGRYPTIEVAAQERRRRTLAALIAQVEMLSQRAPALMIFEDVHWIDPTSLELLGRIVDRIQSLRVLLVATFRPEFDAPWLGQPHVTAVTINRLTRREVGAMVGRVVGNKLLPASITQDIIERTDGIPLFVEEMTKAVLEAESEGAARHTVAAAPPAALAVPPSLQASLMARLDRIGSAKEVAQIGAAIGREFPHALLAAVAVTPETELKSNLDRLVVAGLLFRHGVVPHATYLFKHALVQDAAYSTLLRTRRRQIHASIVATLETQFPEIVTTQPSVLAEHCTKGGLTERALGYWIAAGDLAERRGMVQEAIAHYRAAIALSRELPTPVRAQEPELLMKLGSALQQAEGYGSAASLESYQDARKMADTFNQGENRAKASIGLAPILFASCRYQEVLKFLRERSANSLDQLAPNIRVHLLTMSVVANFGIGEYGTAWVKAAEACALDDESPCTHRNAIGGGDPAVVARHYAGLVGMSLGHFAQCQLLADEALTIARKRGHAFTLAWALLSCARLKRLTGQFADALSLSDDAIAICERHGFYARMGTVLLSVGHAHIGLGEIERGLAEIRRGLDLWRKTSGCFHMSWYLNEFADYLLRAEKYREAESALREAEQIVTETDERSHVGEIHRIRGLLSARRGDITHANTRYLQAIEWARSRHLQVFELRAVRDRARLRFLEGHREEAVKELRHVIACFSPDSETTDLREARELLRSYAGST